MPFVERAGARLYYAEHGEGSDCVVFAHGRGGNAASWWQQIPAFSARYRVLTFDHRGFGRSTCPDSAFDPGAFGDDLAAILDHAQVERAALVCQSMGGRSGMQLSLDRPERVWALVLAATPGGVGVPEVVAGAERRAADAGYVRGERPLAEDFGDRAPELAALYREIRAFNQGCGPRLIGSFTAPGTWIEPARLATLRTPTLMIVAGRDRVFSRAELLAVAALIDGVRVEELPDVGHSTYFEDAAAFNDAVLRFLDPHRPSSAQR